MATYQITATHGWRNFSELVRRCAEGGQEVLIRRYRKPVARLTPAGPSPVTWYSFVRLTRRRHSADGQFLNDLFAARQAKWRSPDFERQCLIQPGTVLLDAPYLLIAARTAHAFNPHQRVATTAAAIAELAAVAGRRGRWTERARLEYLRRVSHNLPVLSFTSPGALLMAREPVTMPFVRLAMATAASVELPLVSRGLLIGPSRQREDPPRLPEHVMVLDELAARRAERREERAALREDRQALREERPTPLPAPPAHQHPRSNPPGRRRPSA